MRIRSNDTGIDREEITMADHRREEAGIGGSSLIRAELVFPQNRGSVELN